jgi:hypothetical protein
MFFTPKNAVLLDCHDCDFKCFKKSDWVRHVSTQKHLLRTKQLNLEQKTLKMTKNLSVNFAKKVTRRETVFGIMRINVKLLLKKLVISQMKMLLYHRNRNNKPTFKL